MTIIFAIILSLITGIVIGRLTAPVNTVVEYVEYDLRPAQVLNVVPLRLIQGARGEIALTEVKP